VFTRRGFLALLGVAATAPLAAVTPRAAVAQEARVPTVGVLVVGAPSWEKFWRIFRDAMRELGYVEGKTVRYEFRSDEGRAERLPALAAELVRLKVDVIVPWFTPAASAAKNATTAIPIVMAGAGDPMGTGLVKSLARPEGNITGTGGLAADLAGKCVELLRKILPSARRIAVLVNAGDPVSQPFLEKVRRAGEAGALAIEPVLIHNAAEIDAAFLTLDSHRPDALIVQPSLPVKHVAELTVKYRLPAAAAFRPFAEEGGLMSYWVSEADQYRRTALIVDRILKGAKPADIPVEQPRKFELVINRKTARALGLTIPRSMLLSADHIIDR
jgi:putative ABC transport system substrate-binding protein